jgi:hypothetical protein
VPEKFALKPGAVAAVEVVISAEALSPAALVVVVLVSVRAVTPLLLARILQWWWEMVASEAPVEIPVKMVRMAKPHQ